MYANFSQFLHCFPWSARILRAVREHLCSHFVFRLDARLRFVGTSADSKRLAGSSPPLKIFLLPYRHSITQLIDIANRDDFISRNAALDLNHVAFSLSALNQTLLRESILDYEHVGRA